MQTDNLSIQKNNLTPGRFEAEYFLHIVAVLLTLIFYTKTIIVLNTNILW